MGPKNGCLAGGARGLRSANGHQQHEQVEVSCPLPLCQGGGGVHPGGPRRMCRYGSLILHSFLGAANMRECKGRRWSDCR